MSEQGRGGSAGRHPDGQSERRQDHAARDRHPAAAGGQLRAPGAVGAPHAGRDRGLCAHGTPARDARADRGAGMAAHLAGAVAAHTTLPVIGVPLAAGPLQRAGRAARDGADAGRHPGRDGRGGRRRERGLPRRADPGARRPRARRAARSGPRGAAAQAAGAERGSERCSIMGRGRRRGTCRCPRRRGPGLGAAARHEVADAALAEAVAAAGRRVRLAHLRAAAAVERAVLAVLAEAGLAGAVAAAAGAAVLGAVRAGLRGAVALAVAALGAGAAVLGAGLAGLAE